MATQTMLKKVANAITGLSSAVSNTFAEQAHAITNAAREAFGNCNWELDAKEVAHVVECVAESSPWKGTSAESARRSEVTTVVKSYPFLGTACDVFKREYGELRREHLVKIARICPTAETATDAGLLGVEFFETRDKKKGKGKSVTPAQKLSAALTTAIDNANDPKLAQALRRIASKYSVPLQ